MSEHENKQDMEKKPSRLASIGELFKHLGLMLLHNWAWKLLCLFLAVCLWGGLIMQDNTLVRSKTISDVTISVVNADVLQRSGFVVVSGLEKESLANVRINVDVPQKYYNQVTAANYNIRVDLSKIKAAGEQTLNVITTSSTTYGTVTSLSVSQITVMVEEYVVRSRIPVRVEMTGDLPENLYGDTPSADPTYVSIAGPKSKIETVVRCKALYDVTDLTFEVGTERTAVSFVLCDRADEPIDMDGITVSTTAGNILLDTITVEQTFYPLYTLPVSTEGLLTGTPSSGYEVKGVSVEPSTVDVAFRTETELEAVYLAGVIDVTDATASIVAAISLDKPSKNVYMSTDKVYITVQIGSVGEAKE